MVSQANAAWGPGKAGWCVRLFSHDHETPPGIDNPEALPAGRVFRVHSQPGVASMGLSSKTATGLPFSLDHRKSKRKSPFGYTGRPSGIIPGYYSHQTLCAPGLTEAGGVTYQNGSVKALGIRTNSDSMRRCQLGIETVKIFLPLDL